MRTFVVFVLSWTVVSLAVGAAWAALRWTPSADRLRPTDTRPDVPAQRASVDRPAQRV